MIFQINDYLIVSIFIIYVFISTLLFQIEESDSRLPMSICNECKIEIIKFYAFRQKTIEADAYFRTLCKVETKDENDENLIICNTASDSFKSETDTHFDFVTVKSEDENLAEGPSGMNNETYLEFEAVNNLSDDDLSNNAVSFDANSDSNYDSNEHEIDAPHKCTICNERFKELSEILPHVEQNHSSFLKNKSISSKTKDKEPTPRKRRKYVKSEKKSRNTKIENQISDNLNSENETDIKTIKREKRSKKSTSVEIKCIECGMTFSNKSSLQKHKKAIHEEDTQKDECSSICNICGELFTSSTKFKDHYMRHFPEECLKCEVCNKLYTNKFRYKNHMLSHSEIKDFKCDLCDYRSATKPPLTVE